MSFEYYKRSKTSSFVKSFLNNIYPHAIYGSTGAGKTSFMMNLVKKMCKSEEYNPDYSGIQNQLNYSKIFIFTNNPIQFKKYHCINPYLQELLGENYKSNIISNWNKETIEMIEKIMNYSDYLIKNENEEVFSEVFNMVFIFDDFLTNFNANTDRCYAKLIKEGRHKCIKTFILSHSASDLGKDTRENVQHFSILGNNTVFLKSICEACLGSSEGIMTLKDYLEEEYSCITINPNKMKYCLISSDYFKKKKVEGQSIVIGGDASGNTITNVNIDSDMSHYHNNQIMNDNRRLEVQQNQYQIQIKNHVENLKVENHLKIMNIKNEIEQMKVMAPIMLERSILGGNYSDCGKLLSQIYSQDVTGKEEEYLDHFCREKGLPFNKGKWYCGQFFGPGLSLKKDSVIDFGKKKLLGMGKEKDLSAVSDSAVIRSKVIEDLKMRKLNTIPVSLAASLIKIAKKEGCLGSAYRSARTKILIRKEKGLL